MALGDKVERLQEISTALTERVNKLLKDAEVSNADQTEMRRILHDQRQEIALVKLAAEKDDRARKLEAEKLSLESQAVIAALRQRIDALEARETERKKQEEERTRRFWSFGPNITAAIITVVLTVLLNLLLPRRQ
ncbi:MAG: hypothetical protein K2W96_16100 [Gemmataceae bacterium]|nr:hypothetical protein [Gemmataceae bacterium]